MFRQDVVYLLYSPQRKTFYIGYTLDPFHRLRQHNGEIVGGAKKTRKGRPWYLLGYLTGFLDHHEGLALEWRWQKFLRKKTVRKGWRQQSLPALLNALEYTLKKGNGSVKKGDKRSWSPLQFRLIGDQLAYAPYM